MYIFIYTYIHIHTYTYMYTHTDRQVEGKRCAATFVPMPTPRRACAWNDFVEQVSDQTF